jgi:hypothetical protein
LFKIECFGFAKAVLFCLFLVSNHSQENLKTQTWRPCWHHKQKKLMTNILLTASSNMAAMTSRANEEYSSKERDNTEVGSHEYIY